MKAKNILSRHKKENLKSDYSEQSYSYYKILGKSFRYELLLLGHGAMKVIIKHGTY